MNHAPRSQRLIGQVLDGVIGAVPVLAALLMAPLAGDIGIALLLAGVAWAMFYVLVADGLSGGRSIAKRWLGMYVIGATTKQPCSFWQ